MQFVQMIKIFYFHKMLLCSFFCNVSSCSLFHMFSKVLIICVAQFLASPLCLLKVSSSPLSSTIHEEYMHARSQARAFVFWGLFSVSGRVLHWPDQFFRQRVGNTYNRPSLAGCFLIHISSTLLLFFFFKVGGGEFSNKDDKYLLMKINLQIYKHREHTWAARESK